MTTSVISQARVSISLFPFGIERSSVERIIASHPGCSDPAEVTHAVQWLISLGDVEDDDGWLKYTGGDTVGTEMESCLTVADAYRIRDLERLAKARKEWKRHVRWARVRGWFGRLWDRIWPAACFLVVITGFSIGLRAQEGSNVNIGRWVLCEVTAYAPNCPYCQTTRITADGTNTDDRPYGVAASRDIGLGSQVWIPADSGYMAARFSDRWFAIDDRGAGLDSERSERGLPRLDVRYRTHASAKLFGRRVVMVYIQEARL